MNRSRGEIEAELSKAITQWEKDFLGRGSVTVKTDIIRDMIVVSLKGILTPAEYALCESKEGMLMTKRTRSALVEQGTSNLNEIVSEVTEQEVISFFTDISTKTGERIIIFKLANNFEKTLNKK